MLFLHRQVVLNNYKNMGGKPSKNNVKKQYLKAVKVQKRSYAKQNQFKLELSEKNWKELILEEFLLLRSSKRKWLLDLVEHTKNWHSSDHRWRSNVQWYDFLQRSPHCLSRSMIIDSDHMTTFDAHTLIDFIKEHLSYPTEHFIASLILKFSEAIIKQGEANVSEVKDFIQILVSCMLHYYGGAVAQLIMDQPGDVYDFLLEHVFTEPLSKIIMKTFPENTDEYWGKLNEYQWVSCQDLGISKRFQLEENGYLVAIDMLRQIEVAYSPIAKVLCIHKTTRCICQCVDQYWKDSDVDAKELVIGSDQIISIILFITIKARIQDLPAHLWLVQEFGRKGMQNSAMGYYLTTIEACIEQIRDLDIEGIEKLRDKITDSE